MFSPTQKLFYQTCFSLTLPCVFFQDKPIVWNSLYMS